MECEVALRQSELRLRYCSAIERVVHSSMHVELCPFLTSGREKVLIFLSILVPSKMYPFPQFHLRLCVEAASDRLRKDIPHFLALKLSTNLPIPPPHPDSTVTSLNFIPAATSKACSHCSRLNLPATLTWFKLRMPFSIILIMSRASSGLYIHWPLTVRLL